MTYHMDLAQTDLDLQQIIALQRKNLPKNISNEESQQQGFVTIEHNFELLKAMNQTSPHIIAKSNQKVIAYALIMLKSFAPKIPTLTPMFKKIDQLKHNNKSIAHSTYLVMGQICIDKAYRSQGIFPKLYQHMKLHMSDRFEYVITEISSNNQRSIKAHAKAKFKTIHQYTTNKQQWNIVLWNWK